MRIKRSNCKQIGGVEASLGMRFEFFEEQSNANNLVCGVFIKHVAEPAEQISN